jgi:predicted component of type VI protein secretion system
LKVLDRLLESLPTEKRRHMAGGDYSQRMDSVERELHRLRNRS